MLGVPRHSAEHGWTLGKRVEFRRKECVEEERDRREGGGGG